jgi:hypothetical protein
MEQKSDKLFKAMIPGFSQAGASAAVPFEHGQHIVRWPPSTAGAANCRRPGCNSLSS